MGERMIRLNLGSIGVNKEDWALLKERYTREEIRQLVINNGIDTLGILSEEIALDKEGVPSQWRDNLDLIEAWRKRQNREIIEIEVCPYCGDERGEKMMCCHECHFEIIKVYEDTLEEVES